jgi:hypothetical protein
MRRVVWPVSSNVQLPVLPDARRDTRNEIASLSQVLQQLDARKNRDDHGKLRSLRQLAGLHSMS